MITLSQCLTARWNEIAEKPILTNDDSHKISSLKGRGICLVHTLATPLKALTQVGKIAMSVAILAGFILAMTSLNMRINKKNLNDTAIFSIQAIVEAATIPLVLFAHVVRGVAGTIFHPGVMIRKASEREKNSYQAKHNLLYGTLVNSQC